MITQGIIDTITPACSVPQLICPSRLPWSNVSATGSVYFDWSREDQRLKNCSTPRRTQKGHRDHATHQEHDWRNMGPTTPVHRAASLVQGDCKGVAHDEGANGSW